MADKYRVHELAKDLNVQSKEILEVLEQKLPDSQRKYQTALSEKEINLALEHFTEKNKIDSTKEFLEASKTEQPTTKETKPATPKTETPVAEKPKATTPEVKPEAKTEETPKTDRPQGDRPQGGYNRPQGDRPQGGYNRPQGDRPQGDRPQGGYNRPYGDRPQGGYNRPQGDRPQGDRPQGDRPQGDRPQGGYNRPYGDRPQGGYNRPQGDRPQGDRPQGDRPQGDRPQGGYNRPYGDRPQGGYNRPQGDRPQGDRPQGDRPQGGYNRPYGDRPQGTTGGYNRPQGDRPQGDRPQGGYNRPYGDRPQGTTGGYNRPQGDRPQGTTGGYNRPQGDRPQGTTGGYNRPQGDRPQGTTGGYNRPQGDRPQGTTGGFNRPQGGGGYNRGPSTGSRGGFGGGFGKDDDRQDRRIEPKKKVLPANRPAYVPQYAADGSLIPLPTHVDTRAANVDLEKYNEKYEKIATTAKTTTKDTDVKKQKFGHRPGRKPVRSRKEIEAEKVRRIELEKQRRERLSITIPEEISVGELAFKLKVQSTEIIKRLMTTGVMASISQMIDYDTAALVAMEIGAKVEREVVVTIEDRLFVPDEDIDDTNLTPRCPVVVVMGHVDHGKTSLLDAIRSANVTMGEAGGITQHIGAYQITADDRPITFLDTPGHAAFTSMRARGAQVTDIAVLVVAADDGIMPQTVEAINHAKAAGVSIIVAINKIDKPAANIEKVKQELTEHSLVPEEWGGDVICVPVSAKTREGIDDLLENILLLAEVAELRANPDRAAKGTVIEAKLDKGRGPVATILVQNGTLRLGDVVIAGTSLGRVRVMQNDKGERIEEAGPSTPVEITGLSEVPSAGDVFNAVADERLAKELAEQRRHEAKEEQFQAYQKVTLDNLFSQISVGEMKELPIIVKADVDGSVEAVKQSLEKLSNEEVRVRVIHGAVGAVSESDVMLADASNAIIIGFNVRPEPMAQTVAERDNVDVRLYRIIYDAIEEVESALKGMLAPKFRDVELGRAEIRAVYKITNVGVVAGCYVLDGKITRNANIRVVRDGIIVADDKLDSLKRFKDDVKDVATGYECGMSLVKFKDMKEGDIFEAYVVEEYRD